MSKTDNPISCIICTRRGWQQFPIPSADEEGKNLQLRRKRCAMVGGVAALWRRNSVPPRIIQSQRSQSHHHDAVAASNGRYSNNMKEVPHVVVPEVHEATPSSSHHRPAPAWLEVKGLDKGRRNENNNLDEEQRIIGGGRKTAAALAVSLSSDEDEEEQLNEEDGMLSQEERSHTESDEWSSPDSEHSLVAHKRRRRAAER